MELCEQTIGHGQFGMFTTPRLIEACEGVTQIPKRDKEKARAFCYNAELKVRRARQIQGQSRPGQVKGTERKATDKTMLRFLLGVDDISDLIRKNQAYNSRRYTRGRRYECSFDKRGSDFYSSDPAHTDGLS
jgi:hypothetical protein